MRKMLDRRPGGNRGALRLPSLEVTDPGAHSEELLHLTPNGLASGAAVPGQGAEMPQGETEKRSRIAGDGEGVSGRCRERGRHEAGARRHSRPDPSS